MSLISSSSGEEGKTAASAKRRDRFIPQQTKGTLRIMSILPNVTYPQTDQVSGGAFGNHCSKLALAVSL